MPLGLGWWYDRRNRRWHLIDEHAWNATVYWRRFRAEAVARMNPVTNREEVVRFVSAQKFVRVRYWRGHLGWEFHGDPDQALSVLRRFLRRHEVGPFTVVNITDFKTDRSICVPASDVLAVRSARALGLTKHKSGGTP